MSLYSRLVCIHFVLIQKTQRARGLKSKCGLIGDAEGRKKNSFPCKAKLRTCGHLTEKKKNLSLVSCTQHVFIYQTGSRANEKINSTDKQPLCPQCVTVNPYGHSRGAAAKTCHTRGKGSSLKPNVPPTAGQKSSICVCPPGICEQRRSSPLVIAWRMEEKGKKPCFNIQLDSVRTE